MRKIYYFKLISTFLLLFLAHSSEAQYKLLSNLGESAFIDIQTHTGKPIVYSDSLNESLKHQFIAFDFRFGVNSFDRTPQDKILRFPNYGLGFTDYNLHSDTLGNPIAIYGFFAFPFNKTNFLKYGAELSTGVTFNFNKFNIHTNPKNDAISTAINVYFNLGLWASARLNERIDVLASTDLTHFSNGNIKAPNKGLNLVGGNLGMRYNFQFAEKNNSFKRKTKNTIEYPDFKPYNELSMWIGIGGKTTVKKVEFPIVYFCSTISADFLHSYSWIGKYGGGLDIFYDGSLITEYSNHNSVLYSQLTFVGLHAGHEFTVANISLVTQMGVYVWKGMDAKGTFYKRVGLKYYLKDKLYINLSLKSSIGLRADYIELGMGHRILWQK